MKKQGLLNHRVAEVVAMMGHGDHLAIGDAGLPIPDSTERIDVAIACGVPGMLDVARTIAGELVVEEVILAQELTELNRQMAVDILALFPNARLRTVTHEVFKALLPRSRAVVRTGECTPYANIILVSGVAF